MEKDDTGDRRLNWLPASHAETNQDATENASPLPWLKNASPVSKSTTLTAKIPVSNNSNFPNNDKSEEKHSSFSIKTLTKYPLLLAIVGVIGVGSMAASMPTLAALDLGGLDSEMAPPPTNVDSQAFVVSRTRFDPTSTVTVQGATATGASAVFTQVVKANFLAEMGDIVTIKNIRVENLGSTNAIASLEVIAPSGVSVDVRSPSGAGNELRLLGPNTFALPINAGSSAEIELRMIILTGPLDPGSSQQFSVQVEVSGLD